MNKKSIGYDFFGNIAILKFSSDWKQKEKKKFAQEIIAKNKSVKTILEKIDRFKGRLRKMQTNYLAGEKTKEALYRENQCLFRFNVETTYFSPRLSNERLEIAKEIKKDESVLVMFAGVAPYPIVIGKNSDAKIIYSNEINREANKYAKMNIELNKLDDKIILLPGDVKKVANKIKKGFKIDQKKIPLKFDVIVMPRPRLKDKFLKEAFSLSKGGKKGTRIYYYDFVKEEGIDSLIENVKKDAKEARKKIKILKIKKAGEVAPYTFRIRIDFKVL